MERETTYCCDHHVDIAFDDFLVDNETFPYLVNITGHKCTYCNKEATYALKSRP
ncbi:MULTISPECIES: CxxH/CxxC protein [Clostridium]|uniref:CxxH/CxxC protein n=1 Tax=Clostridium ragsdalei P11 TaxID=1353534 RepID=A0A1A6B230_9CLOT|nr:MULTISPECIES: CxxH/CxxC protein [Clostridium]OBR96389.1 hypothetical protein CLRAG_05110 [Clostridium ragsdalei P11]QXE19194.1 CxxH/CxxC protein [Clostridium sp. 001]